MSRVCFIGNIPYDLSETQIIEIFSEVGSVQNFRLVFDRDTGKPKGYGFCTFAGKGGMVPRKNNLIDHETAASAVRNLNNYDINGRTLRVDFAEADKEDAFPSSNAGPSKDPRGNTASNTLSNNSVQTITNIIKGMDPQQLAEVLAYLKVMVQSQPDQATALLNENPQLAFGLFQALISMNLVDGYSMQRILQAHPSGYQAPAAGQAQVPQATLSAAQLQEQQKQLLVQLMNLTPEQIQALPPDQQQQVLLLRSQLMNQQ